VKQLNGPHFADLNTRVVFAISAKIMRIQGSDAFHAQSRYDGAENICSRAPGHVDKGEIHRQIQGSAQRRAPEHLSLIRSMDASLARTL
jgi:hypothetical protein